MLEVQEVEVASDDRYATEAHVSPVQDLT